ncbi:hypothetical protein CAOG_06909 [Capsaspora owczarzaki ATCC 30864]|uniref:6-phosphogluconolactonase n=1 Tax=Capsaspora owczarzaki (strain ATCC 30864) TaxID=595528 RepID=A0A0D2X4T3_CAPO3|nr:hypothetical protein CAOG_06909 [Capsaspora owczarzaki ATCC 30864]KJE96609.1 hypothetical protein CAOG_006909 [Capsaspora owczarzaki ATCC 30864]|eukprot:XP_004344530.1 hypothetical protein CAOG_06909 [Capsaspora owczarzaki ATCC 30864]
MRPLLVLVFAGFALALALVLAHSTVANDLLQLAKNKVTAPHQAQRQGGGDGDGDESPLYVVVSGYANFTLTLALIPSEGAVVELVESHTGTNASWVAWHPTNQSVAYAVQELSPQGQVVTLAPVAPLSLNFDVRGNPSPSYGGAPCHLMIHPSGRFAFVANYDDGVTAIYNISVPGNAISDKAYAVRQDGQNAHMMATRHLGNYIYTPFLGSDYVAQYTFDPLSGELAPLATAPTFKVFAGCGPRHIVFQAYSDVAYLICETGSTVLTLAVAPTGELSLLQTLSTIPDSFNASLNTGAEVHISPDGRFVYCSNRGHNSIAMFAVDAATGLLSPLGWEFGNGGINMPRSFAIDPVGNWMVVANQGASTVTILHIDWISGLLQTMGTSTVRLNNPAFVDFRPVVW